MEDKQVDQIQKLKELENALNDLRLDALNVEKKIPGRMERIKALENETQQAKVQLLDLYANLRVYNNQIEEKIREMKGILDIHTGSFFKVTLET